MINKFLVVSLIIGMSNLIYFENRERRDLLHQATVKGYTYIDTDIMSSRSEVIVNTTVRLWKGEDLLNVVKSDERGYYEFLNLLPNETYTVTVDALENYEPLIKKNRINCLNDQYQLNIAYKEKEYRLHYDLDKGYTLFQYDQIVNHALDLIFIPSDYTLKKDGYLFAGWNTHKDGSGETYQRSDTFLMPSRSLTLYATWKKIQAKDKSSYNQIVEKKQNKHIVKENSFVIPLVILFGVGIGIVYKSLKKRKNR